MSNTNTEPKLPDHLPERVKRAYRSCGKLWSFTGKLEIYTFQMTEPVDTKTLEETFGIVCFNYEGPVTRINLEWWEYDGCYAITLNDGEDEFVEPIDKKFDTPTSEEMYAKWKEIINAFTEGVI